MSWKLTGTCVAALLLLTACEQEGEQEPSGVLETEEPGIAEEEQGLLGEEERGIAEEDVERVKGQEAQGQGDMPAQQRGEATLAQITDNPQAYLGKQVAVEGDVEEVYETRGFKVGDMVVLGAQKAAWGVADEWKLDTVQISGTVREASVTELEGDLGWDFDTELQDAIEEKGYVLVADNVSRVAEQ